MQANWSISRTFDEQCSLYVKHHAVKLPTGTTKAFRATYPLDYKRRQLSHKLESKLLKWSYDYSLQVYQVASLKRV